MKCRAHAVWIAFVVAALMSLDASVAQAAWSTSSKLAVAAVTASGTYAGSSPDSVVDGNLGTYWNSGGWAPQWIQLDLGGEFTVSELRMNIAISCTCWSVHEIWAGASLNDMQLYGTLQGMTSNLQLLRFTTLMTDVRYVKINTTNAGASWVGWSEIEVYGHASSDVLVGGIIATASGSYSDPLNAGTPELAVDGNLNNYWNSGGWAPQWIQLDLGSQRSLTKLRLWTTHNGQSTHEIYGGPTTAQMALLGVLDGTTSPGAQQFNFATSATNIRYLKIQTINDGIDWVTWREIQVYAQATNDPAMTLALPMGDFTVTASGSYGDDLNGGTPTLALDGNLSTYWNAGGWAPQWIQVDLGRPRPLSKVRLTVVKSEGSVTTAEIWAGPTTSAMYLLGTVSGFTTNGTRLELATTVGNARYVKIKTTEDGADWVCFKEIELYEPTTKARVNGLGQFGYFGSEALFMGTGQYTTEVADHSTFVHVHGYVSGDLNFPDSLAAKLQKAQDNGVKAIVTTFGVFFDANMNLVSNYQQQWADFWSVISPYVQNGTVLAFYLADEPFSQVGFIPARTAQLRTDLDTATALIRQTTSLGKIYINFASSELESGPANQNFDLVLPARVDWVSFDCYGPFGACNSGISVRSVPWFFNRLLRVTNASHSILLVPDAHLKPDVPLTATNDERVADDGDLYYGLALREGSVVGLFPFIYPSFYDHGSWTGLRDLAISLPRYRALGLTIKNP